MSENQVSGGGEVLEPEGANLFDPDNFVTTSALSGKRGTIVEAEFRRNPYNKPDLGETVGLVLKIVSPALEKPRIGIYGAGGVKPSQDRKTPDIVGPFICGGQLEKRSNTADFLANLKASGFDMKELGAQGVAALVGAEFTWRALEKRIGKKADDVKVYDVPAVYHGRVDVSTLATGGSTEVAPAAAPVDTNELRATVAAAVLQAATEHGEIPRSQLSIRVGPIIKDHPKKADGLALLMDDAFLAKIDGIAYDKKTVRPAPQPQAAAA